MNKNKGFTLVELLIVITVIGILSAFLVNNSRTDIGRARDAQRESDLVQYQNALEVYSVKNNGFYPGMGTGNNGFVQDASAFLCPILGMTKCPTDPQNASNGSYYSYQSGAGGAPAVSGSPTATDYMIFAKLESKDQNAGVQYFAVCSNGKSGLVSNPANASWGWCANILCPDSANCGVR